MRIHTRNKPYSCEVRLGIEGLLVLDMLLAKSLCGVVEQDSLSAALYWFNPRRQKNVPT